MQPSSDSESQPLYSLDSSGFKMISRLTGWRMFMFSSDSWAALSKELYKRFSSGANVIFFDMGRSYGSDLVKAQIKRAEETQVALDPHDFNRLVKEAGWGRVTIDGDLQRGSHLSVVATDCVFCEWDENLEHHCPFLKGVGVGIASTLFKREYDDTAMCSRNKKGEHICKFELYGK